MQRELGRGAMNTSALLQALQRKVALIRLEMLARDEGDDSDDSPFSGLEKTY